jgi:hypothetical protein
VARANQEAGKLCEEGPLVDKPYVYEELEQRIRRLLASR